MFHSQIRLQNSLMNSLQIMVFVYSIYFIALILFYGIVKVKVVHEMFPLQF